jgi:hypothetical protein
MGRRCERDEPDHVAAVNADGRRGDKNPGGMVSL